MQPLDANGQRVGGGLGSVVPKPPPHFVANPNPGQIEAARRYQKYVANLPSGMPYNTYASARLDGFPATRAEGPTLMAEGSPNTASPDPYAGIYGNADPQRRQHACGDAFPGQQRLR